MTNSPDSGSPSGLSAAVAPDQTSTQIEPATGSVATAGGRRVEHTAASERVQSVDVLRGFDMFWISGGDHLFHALAIATGWSGAVFLSNQLKHSHWAGFTCYDLIQPLFLFITGITLPLSIGRRLARGQTRWTVFRRLLTRAMFLVLLGHLVKNGAISFDVPHIRFTSVLGRIGVAGLAAGVIIMFTRVRAQIIWAVGILIVYWALLTFVPAPGQPGPSFNQGVNIVDYLDQHVMPGRLASGNHDANGWFSTPPVVATVLLGALAGAWLLSARNFARKALGLAGAGLALVALGWLWGLQCPIIKHIWTSSYVLYAGGWSCLLLALFYAIVDGLRWRRWGFPFLLIGMNPCSSTSSATRSWWTSAMSPSSSWGSLTPPPLPTCRPFGRHWQRSPSNSCSSIGSTAANSSGASEISKLSA